MSDSQTYQFTGTVINVGQVQTVGASGFQKSELIVSNDATDYPQEIPFFFTGKKADVPHREGICEGDKVTVHFELRGRPWQNRWFGENSAWKIDRLGSRPKAEPAPDPNQGDFYGNGDDDPLDENIPF